MKKTFTIIYITLFWIPMNNSIFASMSLSSNQSIQAVILAAGEGSRLKTGITKLITPICGQPMVLYTVRLMSQLGMPTTVIIGYQKDAVKKAIDAANITNLFFAEQAQQLGTGHALMCSKNTWIAENILVMNGDMPLVTPEIINGLTKEHFANKAAISIVTCYNIDPANAFGRIVQNGNTIKIVEKKHFIGDIKDNPYVNAGVYIINRDFLEKFLSMVKQNENSKEFYITDLVEIASNNNLPVVTVPFPFETLNGVNTFQELAVVEQIKRDELIHLWMARGVRFIAPNTVHIDLNVIIGRGTVISSGVQLLNGTTIGEFCSIAPHAVLDNAIIENNVTIGAHSLLQNTHVKKDTMLDAFSKSLTNQITI
jgi:bifunctional UDP-N-acetylglucosamine pyrophosphorylase / glucosamine-1-phosphate N-acetyltransferase